MMSERFQEAVNELLASGFQYERATDSWKRVEEECRVVTPLLGLGEYQRIRIVKKIDGWGRLWADVEDCLTTTDNFTVLCKRKVTTYPLQQGTKVTIDITSNVGERKFNRCDFWYDPEYFQVADGSWGIRLLMSLQGIYNVTYNFRGELARIVLVSTRPSTTVVCYQLVNGEILRLGEGEEKLVGTLPDGRNVSCETIIDERIFRLVEQEDFVEAQVISFGEGMAETTLSLKAPAQIDLFRISQILAANSKDWLYLSLYIPIGVR